MYKLILILSVLAILSCQKEEINYVLLSGTILNHTGDKVTISKVGFSQEFKMSPEGTFSDTLKLTEAGFYNIYVENNTVLMYLKNGDNLKFSVDQKEFRTTIKYLGGGAEENNYLAVKNKIDSDNLSYKSKVFYKVNEATFKTQVEESKNSHLKALNAIENVDKAFLKFETRNLKYDAYNALDSYEGVHAYYIKNDDFKVSDSFLPPDFKTLKYDNATDYKMSKSYKELALYSTLDLIEEKLNDGFENAKIEDFSFLTGLEIPALKDDVAENAASFLLSPENPKMKLFYNLLSQVATNTKTKQRIEEVYVKNRKTIKGLPSPVFTAYKNHDGSVTSLKDFKGKYVYIDIWATWCAPCIAEIPSLKKLEKKYQNSNIEFVSISIDKERDYDKWVNMVKDKDLGGSQVFADNNFDSKFIQDYNINAIPRFILIDADGNIVSANAPRPSDSNLVDILNKELL